MTKFDYQIKRNDFINKRTFIYVFSLDIKLLVESLK